MKTITEKLDFLANSVWKNQRDFFRNGVQPKEEVITDNLFLLIKDSGWPNVDISLIGKHTEGKVGADLDFWIGNDSGGWLRYCVQAKILEIGKDRYSSLFKKNKNGFQHQLLKKYGLENRAEPIYLFYNYVPNAKVDDIWRCCEDRSIASFGCSYTSLFNIELLKYESGRKTFSNVHRNYDGQPLKCIACFKFEYCMESIPNFQDTEAPVLEDYDNHHDHLPEDVRSGTPLNASSGAEEFEGPKYRLIIKVDDEDIY